MKSTIGPGKFTTQVEALFNYSGDGDPSSRVIGRDVDVKKQAKITDREAFSRSGYCTNVFNQVISTSLRAEEGQTYTKIDQGKAEKKQQEAEQQDQTTEIVLGGGTEPSLITPPQNPNIDVAPLLQTPSLLQPKSSSPSSPYTKKESFTGRMYYEEEVADGIRRYYEDGSSALLQ